MATKPSDAAKTAPKRTKTRSATAARKPAGAAKAKAAPRALAEATGTEAATTTAPVAKAAGEALKMKQLVTQVAAATGAKKPVVKSVAEAVLALMGDALSKGQDLNLPPLGKAKVGRQKGTAGDELIVVKLKRGGGKPAGKKDVTEGVAEAED
ncbi:hypothetical protein D2N39_12495 [Gemmobacter lutimaris]|uniref:DNA-binding protein n=1 Tax=Gemmobacter lutimaris TaxID=2306023 RepID=A0A398BPP3_9RHOB|nr:HU family DNA-binding protein [Gemmobacter lutimaris]RID91517.1 hypothetical protein D2N39_12495 [Gemmobacter lutimaris]